jgi:hypothetical protein
VSFPARKTHPLCIWWFTYSYCTNCVPRQQLLYIGLGHNLVWTPFTAPQITPDLSVLVVSWEPTSPCDGARRDPSKLISAPDMLLVLLREIFKSGRTAFTVDLGDCRVAKKQRRSGDRGVVHCSLLVDGQVCATRSAAFQCRAYPVETTTISIFREPVIVPILSFFLSHG